MEWGNEWNIEKPLLSFCTEPLGNGRLASKTPVSVVEKGRGEKKISGKKGI